MNHSEDINELAAALSKAQAEMDDAHKGKQNPFLKSKYADLESIRAAVIGPLTNHGLSVIQGPCSGTASIGLDTMILHQSGQWISTTVYASPATLDDPQKLGSWLTYLRRYSLAAMTGIATTDDDGEAAVVRSQPRKTSPDLAPKTAVAAAYAVAKDVLKLQDKRAFVDWALTQGCDLKTVTNEGLTRLMDGLGK